MSFPRSHGWQIAKLGVHLLGCRPRLFHQAIVLAQVFEQSHFGIRRLGNRGVLVTEAGRTNEGTKKKAASNLIA